MPDTQHGKQLSLCYPTGTGGAGQCSRAKPILTYTILQRNNPVSPGLSHQGPGSLQNGTEPGEVWDRLSYQIHGKERSHSPFIKEETRLRQVQPRVQGHTNQVVRPQFEHTSPLPKVSVVSASRAQQVFSITVSHTVRGALNAMQVLRGLH